jgi:hypothetical protein
VAGKATPVPFSGPGRNFGTHKSAVFNMDDEDDALEYSEIRTKNNDPASGIKIERIKEMVRTEVEVTSSREEGRTETREDHLCLFVEWWEAKPVINRGEDPAPKDFGVEWSPAIDEKPGN